jgi:hypothetical protein
MWCGTRIAIEGRMCAILCRTVFSLFIHNKGLLFLPPHHVRECDLKSDYRCMTIPASSLNDSFKVRAILLMFIKHLIPHTTTPFMRSWSKVILQIHTCQCTMIHAYSSELREIVYLHVSFRVPHDSSGLLKTTPPVFKILLGSLELPLLDLGHFFSFLILRVYTVSRTPWAGD